jgi:hypothetical protein
MTEEQYQRARHLRNAIASRKEALAILSCERNNLHLPQELWDRHLAEKRAYLEGELSLEEAAFAAL